MTAPYNPHQEALDQFVVSVMREQAGVIEERIRLLLQPKPGWLPSWAWHRLLSRMLVVEHQGFRR